MAKDEIATDKPESNKNPDRQTKQQQRSGVESPEVNFCPNCGAGLIHWADVCPVCKKRLCPGCGYP